MLAGWDDIKEKEKRIWTMNIILMTSKICSQLFDMYIFKIALFSSLFSYCIAFFSSSRSFRVYWIGLNKMRWRKDEKKKWFIIPWYKSSMTTPVRFYMACLASERCSSSDACRPSVFLTKSEGVSASVATREEKKRAAFVVWCSFSFALYFSRSRTFSFYSILSRRPSSSITLCLSF